jgi:hypothetical protein
MLGGQRGVILGVWPIGPDITHLQNTHLNRFTVWNCQISKLTASGVTLMDSWSSSLFEDNLAITYSKWPEGGHPGRESHWAGQTTSAEHPSE